MGHRVTFGIAAYDDVKLTNITAEPRACEPGVRTATYTRPAASDPEFAELPSAMASPRAVDGTPAPTVTVLVIGAIRERVAPPGVERADHAHMVGVADHHAGDDDVRAVARILRARPPPRHSHPRSVPLFDHERRLADNGRIYDYAGPGGEVREKPRLGRGDIYPVADHDASQDR